MKLKSIFLKLFALCAAGLMAAAAAAQPGITVHTTDFIPDSSRTGFNGFENIPNDGNYFTGGGGPYAEGGITVQQINGNTISVTYRPTGSEGKYGWYPWGGDSGYTKITRTDGADFSEVGMLVGSGFSFPGPLAYELLKQGAVVASGTVDHRTEHHYLGFSGGGFDTILLADGNVGKTFSVRDGHYNGLAVDSIELGGGVVVKTLPENIACASDAIAALKPADEIIGRTQQTHLLQMLSLAGQYQATRYRSLSLFLVNAVLARVDGCAMRGKPDSEWMQGVAGMDYVAPCPVQAPIYACLKDAQKQLSTRPVP